MKQAILIASTVVFLVLAGFATIVFAFVVWANSFGSRITFKNGELYYTENVQEAEAQQFADLLEEQFGDLENQKSFQLDRIKDDVIVKMCAVSKAWETDELDYSYRAIEAFFQVGAFEGENVIFHICDPNFTIKKTFDELPVVAEVLRTDHEVAMEVDESENETKWDQVVNKN